jgi:hypothetical protein
MEELSKSDFSLTMRALFRKGDFCRSFHSNPIAPKGVQNSLTPNHLFTALEFMQDSLKK